MQTSNEGRREKRTRFGSPVPGLSKRTKESDRITEIDDRVEMRNEREIGWEQVVARRDKKYEGKNNIVYRERMEDSRKEYNDRQNEEMYKYRARNRIERTRKIMRN